MVNGTTEVNQLSTPNWVVDTSEGIECTFLGYLMPNSNEI